MKRLIFFLVLILLVSSISLFSCANEMPKAPDGADTDVALSPVMLPSQEVRVISINVGYDIQNMAARGRLMVPLLLSYEPDSIGTQECGGYTDWVDYFREGLIGYERVGRLSNGSIETADHYSGNYIYYNAEKYECEDWYTFWASKTPSHISSYDNAMYRTCTWAVLRDRQTGFRYVHINTHLAFENDEINEFQIGLVREIVLRFNQLGIPVFLTGDFNTSEGSFSYQMMTSVDAISDSKYLAEKSMSSGTFRGWGDRDVSGNLPIDFCFVTGDKMSVREYQVIDTYVDEVALTDHLGLFVHAAVNSLPDHPYKLSNEGIVASETSCRAYVYEFSFTQVKDVALVHKYIAELVDSNGNVLQTRSILSRNLDENFEESLNCTFTALTPETKYTVNIYAVAYDMTYSEPVTFEFTSSKN